MRNDISATPVKYDEIAEFVRGGAQMLPIGGGTKPSLSTPPADFDAYSTASLSGIVEYEPSEFTITAQAGTPLREIATALAEHGQYLPWDPPLVDAGATLGGAIAAGLSGSGRYRYGGLRDFLVGIRFVDGHGRLVRGGGKVVKNAAGFDLPKLFVGSMGRLGILVEATFKVFPQPPAWTTLRLPQIDMGAAQRTLAKLAIAPLDINALDLEIPGAGAPVIWLRLGGLASALPERAECMVKYVSAKDNGATIVEAENERDWWQATASVAWTPSDSSLLYASLLPSRLREVDAEFTGIARRYICGGNILWLAPNADQSAAVDSAMAKLDLTAIRVRGEGTQLLNLRGNGLLTRVKATLDPHGIFPSW